MHTMSKWSAVCCLGINAVSSNQFVNESNVKQVNMAPKKHDLNSCEHDREKEKNANNSNESHIFLWSQTRAPIPHLQSSVDQRSSNPLHSICIWHFTFDHTYGEHAERLKFT